VYGGEYEFDNYTVKLHNYRGTNRGVSIRYGKNLADIKQDQNCSSVATGIYPYWAGVVDESDVLVELPEKIVNAPGTYNFVKIRTLDLSTEFETQPTVEQLRSRTQNYIQANNIGVPVVSWSVSFAQLEQSEEYKHLALFERVSLFDTVNVEFPALGVSATAKAVKMVYDVLADRVKSVTLGSVRANIADTIASQKQEISNVSKDKLNVSIVQKISSALAKAIMGANGGAVRLIDTNDDGEPDELYIADNADPNQAVKVWRFNYNGWAASKSGYAGPFEFGATLEDGLLANFVTAAQLVAGTIKSNDDGKTFYLDLDNGILRMQATEFSVSGKTVEQIAEGKASDAVKAQTQLDILNKLTNNGILKGLFMYNGELCVNASAILTGILKGVEIIGEFGTIGGFTMSDHTLSAVFRKDYPVFTQADLEKAVAYRVGSTTLTAEEIEKYDVNMTGDVDTADVSTMQGMMEGTVPTYSEGRIILDATNPKETIVLEVTAGYRAGERLALGMGLAKATKFIADTFACGADNGYTGTVAVGDKTLTIKGGIITSVS
jgi:hypothetical protein